MPALAAALLSLTTMPAPAQPSAAAGSTPTRAVERITAEATVVSTADYYVALPLNCAQALCQGDLPVVGGRRRLNLTRISCWMITSTYSNFALGQVDLRSGETSISLVQVLPADHSNEWGYHSLNRAVDVKIPARHHVRILLSLASGGQAQAAACTAHGTLDTLQ